MDAYGIGWKVLAFYHREMGVLYDDEYTPACSNARKVARIIGTDTLIFRDIAHLIDQGYLIAYVCECRD
jgi:hypothetical protein